MQSQKSTFNKIEYKCESEKASSGNDKKKLTTSLKLFIDERNRNLVTLFTCSFIIRSHTGLNTENVNRTTARRLPQNIETFIENKPPRQDQRKYDQSFPSKLLMV